MHLLVETAMGDSGDYTILSPEELEEVKKEEDRLVRRIEASKRRLFLESRVENTARLLRKLAARGRIENGITSISSSPQHLKLPGAHTDTHDSGIEEGAEEEDDQTQKFGTVAQDIWRLERRRNELHNIRLEHTAGVLQKSIELRALGGQGDMQDDELDFDDAIPDSALSSPRQSLSHLSQLLDGTLEALGGFGDQRERLRLISRTLYQFLVDSASPGQDDVRAPPGLESSSAADVAYLEEAIHAIRSRFSHLHDTLTIADTSVTQYEVEYQQNNTMLADLWDAVSSAEDNLKRNSYVMHQTYPDTTSDTARIDEDVAEDVDLPEAQALVRRIHRLCQQAESLSRRLLAAKDELEIERQQHNHYRSVQQQETAEMIEQIQLLHDKHMGSQAALADAETKLSHNANRVEDMHNMIAANERQLVAEHEDTLANERAIHQDMKESLLNEALERQAALDEAQAKLAVHEANIGDLHSAQNMTHDKMRDLTARLEELTAALQAAENDATNHKATAEGYEFQLNDLQTSKAATEAQYQHLQIEHDDVAAHLNTIMQRAADHEAKASDLQQDLQRAQDVHQTQQEQIDTLTRQLQAANTQSGEHDSITLTHKQQIQQLDEERQRLQHAYDQLRSSNAQLGHELEASEIRALEHEAAAQDGANELLELQEQLDRLREQHSSSEAQLNDAEILIHSKDATLTQHADRAATLGADKADLETETARLRAELDTQVRSQQELEGLRSRYDVLAAEMESLRGRVGDDSHRNAELEAQLSKTTESRTDSEGRVETLQKELAELVQDYEILVREELEVEKERESMESTIDDLKQKVEALEVTLGEERIRAMGKRHSMLSERGANEGMASKFGRAGAGTTMSVMRNEFKKMMREARADHFRSLKVSGGLEVTGCKMLSLTVHRLNKRNDAGSSL